MPERGEVTIFDVAQDAGVSITTVSRVLNNKPDVAQKTRQRVLETIETLGYTPHLQARRLAARQTRTIALIYPLDRAFGQLELDFIVGAAAEAGNANFFFSFVTTPITKSSLLNMYRSAQVDGIILMEIHMQDWRVDLLREHQYPFVMIGRCANNEGLCYIDLDLETGVIQAFDHLIDLGHQDIAFLGLPQAMRHQGYGPAVHYWAGYEKAQEKYQLQASYREAGTNIRDLSEATLSLLEENPQLTAIVATQGALTVGVLRALNQLDRQVPQDFSVVGVTTDMVAELITPPLTVINLPAYTQGRQAARMLIKQLEQKPKTATQILLPPELIIRQSTGPRC